MILETVEQKVMEELFALLKESFKHFYIKWKWIHAIHPFTQIILWYDRLELEIDLRGDTITVYKYHPVISKYLRGFPLANPNYRKDILGYVKELYK